MPDILGSYEMSCSVMVPLRGPPVLLSFRHGASLPFRPVPPVPPPARRTLYRAYPARARAGVGAGAVRAPDCPRARQAQGAPLPPAESGSSGRAGGGPRGFRLFPDPSYHGFSRPGPGKGKHYRNLMNLPPQPFTVRGSRPPVRPCRAPPPFVTPAPEPGSIPDRLRQPQPFERKPNRRSLPRTAIRGPPREPEMDPGSSPG